MSAAPIPTSPVVSIIDILRKWAHELVTDSYSFDRVYVFGSLVYKDGQQFMSDVSDVDLLIRFSDETATPVQRLHACESLLERKRILEQQLAAVVGDTSRPRVSTVVVSSFELEQGIHKDNAARFFSDSDFLDLLDSSKPAAPLTHKDGGILWQPTFIYVLPAIRLAQKTRNTFLAVGPFDRCGLRVWNEKDVVPKELMRTAAELRYFAQQLRDDSTFDVNRGLEYLHGLIHGWSSKGDEYSRLAEWETVRRGGRGQRDPLRPQHYLLLCEILSEEAMKRARQKLGGGLYSPQITISPTLRDERGFLSRAQHAPPLNLGRLDLGCKLFPPHLWDSKRSETDGENVFVDHPEGRGIELIWAPAELPNNLVSQFIDELEAELKKPEAKVASASDSTRRAHKAMEDAYQRLTEEGSNAYPRLAGNPEVRNGMLQVPIGPSKYGIALIEEKKIPLPTAEQLRTQYVLNSLAVRVAYIYRDTHGVEWVEFQERQERENATYSGAWDVSAAGYIDPQRHEDPKERGRVSPWKACADELWEELNIPRGELPNRDHYIFLGVGRNEPTGQLDLLAYCRHEYVPDPHRPPSKYVKSYGRAIFEPDAIAEFILAKRRWVPTALLTLVLALEARGYPMERIKDAFAICTGFLDLSP